MKKSLLFTLLSSSLLTGCAFVPLPPEDKILTMNEIRAMDYGNYPKNYEKTIKQYLYKTLIDPNSLMIDGFSKPRKILRIDTGKSRNQDYYYDLIIPSTGYLVCVRFNAKNRYGGYTGWTLQAYTFKNDKLIYVEDKSYLCEQAGDVVIDKYPLAPVKIVD